MKENWKLTSAPAYAGGRLYPVLFNCGSGAVTDSPDVGDEDSHMHVVHETNREEFLSYCAELEKAGNSLVWENRNETGIFREYRGEKRFYVYHIDSEGTTRIIENNSGVSVPEFEDKDCVCIHGNTALMQFGLYYSDMVHGTTCDCGMLYAIRLRSNEVIIVDGGECEQATEAAVEEFMLRLRSLTGNRDRIDIAAWFCTHPHDDHIDFFAKLMRKYGSELNVKRAMFNFPSHRLYTASPKNAESVRRVKERLSGYPGLKYLKLHTGQTFELCGAKVEVLLTHEDILSRHGDDCPYEGLNEASTILRISFDGTSVIFLGDCHASNGDVLIGRYAHSGLDCTFLQAAHHCINSLWRLYGFIKMKYVLIPECRYIIQKHLWENYRVIRNYCEERNTVVAGDATCIFFAENGRLSSELHPVAGGPYDGSEI